MAKTNLSNKTREIHPANIMLYTVSSPASAQHHQKNTSTPSQIFTKSDDRIIGLELIPIPCSLFLTTTKVYSIYFSSTGNFIRT